ncbi:MAG: hypothetical protein GY771_14170 [bacterium]|nr:hypothetical protein [bacterium]
MNEPIDTPNTETTSEEKLTRVVIMERQAHGRDLSVRLKVIIRRFSGDDGLLDEMIRQPRTTPLSLVTLNKEKELVSVELVNRIAADNVRKYLETNEDYVIRENFEFPQMNLYSVEMDEIISSVADDIWDGYE